MLLNHYAIFSPCMMMTSLTLSFRLSRTYLGTHTIAAVPFIHQWKFVEGLLWSIISKSLQNKELTTWLMIERVGFFLNSQNSLISTKQWHHIAEEALPSIFSTQNLKLLKKIIYVIFILDTHQLWHVALVAKFLMSHCCLAISFFSVNLKHV